METETLWLWGVMLLAWSWGAVMIAWLNERKLRKLVEKQLASQREQYERWRKEDKEELDKYARRLGDML